MNLFALLMALSFSLISFADTSAYESFVFDGSNLEETIELNTEKTKKEYRTVRVPSTCYRTEYRHRCFQERVCSTRCPNGQCRRFCRPRRVCRTVPVQVPYSCERRVRRAYDVFDYYVDTKVNFKFEIEDVLAGAFEDFKVEVSGENVSVSVKDSRNYLILQDKVSSNAKREGDTLNQNLEYRLRLIPAEVVTSALDNGVQNVSLNNGVVRFTLGAGFNTEDFIQNLQVYRSRRIISDVLLLDKNLSADDMEIRTLGQNKEIMIDLNEIGVDVPSRVRIILTTTFNTKGATILNSKSFKTEASANWIFSK
ncbi:MAG: hypothetical protein KC478_16705 [Bacteriovoracaceae bacterium]|nr:hypothetical protein [Bacteriovoracaceae bacterium]